MDRLIEVFANKMANEATFIAMLLVMCVVFLWRAYTKKDEQYGQLLQTIIELRAKDIQEREAHKTLIVELTHTVKELQALLR